MNKWTKLIATTAFAALASGAAAQDFVMKLSSPVPPTERDVVFAWMTAFEAGVEDASGGRIDVQLYPANQLGQIPATVEGVAMGTIEMTLPIIGFLAALDPRFGTLDASGLFDDEAHAMRTLAEPDVQAMLATFGEVANVEPLVIMTSGQAVLVTTDPTPSLTELEGLKLRTGGATPLLNEPMEALGAGPVALPLGEVLPALQTGGIDGAVLNMAVLNAFQVYDVATEATYLPGNFSIIGGLVSKDFLAMIGPDLEAIVRDEAQKALSVHVPARENSPAALEGLWRSNGGTITMPDADAQSAYLDTVRPVIEGIVAQDAQQQSDYNTLNAAAERTR